MPNTADYDVIILGGGAAGLMCALTAGQRGRKVLVLEVSNKLGKKILMSGGGRCNFTNLEVLPEHFLCANPHFVKSALNQYTQWDFISLVAKHNVPYHEKAHGQLFCDRSAKDILALLVNECTDAGVEFQMDSETSSVVQDGDFRLQTSRGRFSASNLVVACGGLSIPTLGGATGFGYRLAEQFGLQVNTLEASLVPLTLTGKWHEFSMALSGVSLPVVASVSTANFAESLLFTHRGLSGPAILQLSNYWHLGESIYIDLFPSVDLGGVLLNTKQQNPKSTVTSVLNDHFPKSFVTALQERWWGDKPLHEYKDNDLTALAKQFHAWQLTPSGTEGYRTAEVTRGGVDVAAISSKTMQVNDVSGLYFVGEVLDVTGHLGGFNFQWAWSSGYVAGINV